jgi:hypothetical protein
VEGKAGYGGSKKTARQAAALSLLAALTGLAVPADNDPPAAPRGLPDDPGLRPADLESWLDYEVARPSPDPELAAAVRPGKLTARSVYLLLFEADPPGWASARCGPAARLGDPAGDACHPSSQLGQLPSRQPSNSLVPQR